MTSRPRVRRIVALRGVCRRDDIAVFLLSGEQGGADSPLWSGPYALHRPSQARPACSACGCADVAVGSHRAPSAGHHRQAVSVVSIVPPPRDAGAPWSLSLPSAQSQIHALCDTTSFPIITPTTLYFNLFILFVEVLKIF